MASEISGISSLKQDRRVDFLAALLRRDYIINTIGKDNLGRFEDWAFKSRDLIYDRNISFQWLNIHGTKGIPEDPDLAVKVMVKLWFFRHARDAVQNSAILDILNEDLLGPGLDSEEA